MIVASSAKPERSIEGRFRVGLRSGLTPRKGRDVSIECSLGGAFNLLHYAGAGRRHRDLKQGASFPSLP